MANEAPIKPKYRIKGGDGMTIPGCPVKFTNANINTEVVQAVLANEGRKSGVDYFKLCLEKV